MGNLTGTEIEKAAQTPQGSSYDDTDLYHWTMPDYKQAIDALEVIDEFLEGGEWRVAAIVAAYVGPARGKGNRRDKGNFPFIAVTALAQKRINGLKDPKTIRKYRDAWFDNGLAQPVWGQPVSVPPGLEWKSEPYPVHLGTGASKKPVWARAFVVATIIHPKQESDDGSIRCDVYVGKPRGKKPGYFLEFYQGVSLELGHPVLSGPVEVRELPLWPPVSRITPKSVSAAATELFMIGEFLSTINLA